MKLRVDCPSPIYNIEPGNKVKIKLRTSHVSNNSTYVICEFENKCIGMCEDNKELISALKEKEYIEATVTGITVVNYNTSLKIIIP